MNATNIGYDVDYQPNVFDGAPTAEYRMTRSILTDNFQGVRHFVVEYQVGGIYGYYFIAGGIKKRRTIQGTFPKFPNYMKFSPGRLNRFDCKRRLD